MNLFSHIQSLLEQNENYFQNGKILKNKVAEAALGADPALLTILLQDEKAKKAFFAAAAGVWVFDKIKFQKFISNKEFLPDSFTAFKNKIGLAANSNYLDEAREVVLDFPYKDCVLEGGQAKETEKRREIFWNEVLAPDEIDRLLEPKVLTGWQQYDRRGAHEVQTVSREDSLVIKGNNLIALHSLAEIYTGKVKLIYIDPPYNTGSDGFQYNDAFNHATWLVFMKNRLEVARQLLSAEGSIWINIDDHESHYLKVLCDSVFGRENFLINFIWQKKYSPSNDAKFFSDNHDHILVFAKDKKRFKPNLLARTEEMNARYRNPDNDPRGPWKPGGFSVKSYSKDYDYPIETPSGKVVHPPKGSCWQTSEENYQKKRADNRIWFGINGDAKPQLKQFLSEVQLGVVAKSIWLHDEAGHNQISRSEIIQYLGSFDFATPKPEKLLKRIIELGSSPGDIVLDFFAGSGTTAAVAMKMHRKFIAIEQMDYIKNVTVKRLCKVMEGAQIGITEEVGWQGGGSFIYCELLELNQKIVKSVAAARTHEELAEISARIQNSPYLSYRFDQKNIAEIIASRDISLARFKEILLKIIDANMLYVPLSEMEDADFGISAEDKKLSRIFYKI